MERNIVIINQAVNYLTIDLCNEFIENNWRVTLITGSIHEQGEELDGRVEVHWINPFSKNVLRKKIISWLKATWKIYILLFKRYRNHQLLFISNPPISYCLMLLLSNRFYLVIWDLYPDVLQVFGYSHRNFIVRTWSFINRKIFGKSCQIYTIGEKMAEAISGYVSRDKITIVPLWTSFNSFHMVKKEKNHFIEMHHLRDKFVIQYSGTIGFTHNVETLLELATEVKFNERILFQIIGWGSRFADIRKRIISMQLKNCQILTFQSDEDFPYSLAAADVGVVLLDNKTSMGSVPSKTYNLMAAGKPILYIASRESELYFYSQKYKNGFCFDEVEKEDMIKYILKLEQDKDFYEKLSRNSLRASSDFTRQNAKKLVLDLNVLSMK